MARHGHGHRRAGEEAEEVVEYRKESGNCGVEGGDGPDHGAEVSGSGAVAQRVEEGASLADAGGSVQRGLGRSSAAGARKSAVGGQDAVRMAATGIPGTVQRWADPDPATADPAVAGGRRGPRRRGRSA